MSRPRIHPAYRRDPAVAAPDRLPRSSWVYPHIVRNARGGRRLALWWRNFGAWVTPEALEIAKSRGWK